MGSAVSAIVGVANTSTRIVRAKLLTLALAVVLCACAPAAARPGRDPAGPRATQAPIAIAAGAASVATAEPLAAPVATAGSTPTTVAPPTVTTPPATRPALTPVRPTVTPAAGSKVVYEPTGRCQTDLPPFFIEEKPDGGYYPAANHSGFAGLDAHELTGGRGYDEEIGAALAVVRGLVADYEQTASTQVDDSLQVTFTGGVNSLNGHGAVLFRRFGGTLCQVTIFVLDYANVPSAPLLESIGGRLQLVDPAAPRPTASAPPATIPPTSAPRAAAPTGDPTELAVALIEAVPAMRYIADNMKTNGVRIAPGRLATGVYGSYNFTLNAIRYAPALAGFDAHDLAAVLGHEGQHAYDALTIGPPSRGASCFQIEYRGFWAEAMLWQAWYGPAGKPNPSNDLEREENIALADVLHNDGRKVRAFIARAYQDQCGLRIAVTIFELPMPALAAVAPRARYVRRSFWVA